MFRLTWREYLRWGLPLPPISGGALVNVGVAAWPAYETINNLNTDPTTLTSLLLDATGEKAAFIVQAPKTGNIRKVGFRTGAVTTATDTDVRIETVDLVSGNPSGTLWAANTNVTVAAASITANSWITTGALTADAAVTQGDFLAVVIAPTGTPNYNIACWARGPVAMPYTDHFTTAWAKQRVAPAVALEYSDGSYAPIVGAYPLSSVLALSFHSGSTPNEKGFKIVPPFTGRLVGVYWVGLATADYQIKVYDAAGTTLITHAHDGNVTADGGDSSERIEQFASPQVLQAGQTYRVTWVPTTTSNIRVAEFNVASAAVMEAMPGGSAAIWTERTGAGAWTDVATRRPVASLLFDQLDDGAGAGAGGTTNIFIVHD